MRLSVRILQAPVFDNVDGVFLNSCVFSRRCTVFRQARVFINPCLFLARSIVSSASFSIYQSMRVFNNKHLMTGPKGNSEFCFPETLNVPLGFASGNIEVKRKQNSLFPEGQVIKCFVIPPNSKIGKKKCDIMICTSGSRAELSCRNDVATITVYFFAANKSLHNT